MCLGFPIGIIVLPFLDLRGTHAAENVEGLGRIPLIPVLEADSKVFLPGIIARPLHSFTTVFEMGREEIYDWVGLA